MRPQCFYGSGERLFARVARQRLEVVPLKLPDPIFHAVGAVKRGAAVEQISGAQFKADAFEQRTILSDGREIGAGGGNLRAPVEAGQHGIDSVKDVSDVALSSEFGYETAGGSKGQSDPFGDAPGVRHPVQGGVREDGAEFGTEEHFGGVSQDESERGEVLARLSDHVRRCVEARYLRAAFGDLRGQLAGTAAEVKDALARFGVKEFNDAGSEFPDEIVFGFVEFSIPG